MLTVVNKVVITLIQFFSYSSIYIILFTIQFQQYFYLIGYSCAS